MSRKVNRFKGTITDREAEVAAYLCFGLSQQEVADILFVANKTIKFHCTHIYKKLGVISRVEMLSRFHMMLLDAEQTARIQKHIEKLRPTVEIKRSDRDQLPKGLGQ